MYGPVGVVAWQLFKDEDSSSRMVIFSVFYSVRQRCIFDPEIISPQNFFWPWKLFDEHIWFLAISGAYQCWRTKRRWSLPRRVFASHIAQNYGFLGFVSLFLFFFKLSHPHPLSFHPHPHHLPLGSESWEGKRDGWCCFEPWHVSMQVIPLLFINNWPGPTVGAIYGADCCFAKEYKVLELHFLPLMCLPNRKKTPNIRFRSWEASYKALDLG